MTTDKNAGKTLYLTFDDGPSVHTVALLDMLRKYNACATFFVVGEMIPGKEELLKRMVRDGHTVAVHTYIHDYDVVYSSEKAFWEDNLRTREMIAEITGTEPTIMRFPGGSSNTVSRRYCSGIMSRLAAQTAEYGYTYFDWNITSNDILEPDTPQDIHLERVMSGIHQEFTTPVILMHDVDKLQGCVSLTELILKSCSAEGYTFSAITSSMPYVHHRIAN